jgi:OOP family OmpA-OmpF porin
MRKISEKLLSVLLLWVLISLIPANPVFAGNQELNQKIQDGKYAQNAQTFLILFDATSSMYDSYQNQFKFDQEKQLVTLFNNTIPNLKLSAALREFGQYFFSPELTKRIYGMCEYNRDALNKAILEVKTPHGNTPLDVAITSAGQDLANSEGNLALIIFSDGEDVNEATVVKAASHVKDKYGDRICIYTVQLGNNLKGGRLLERIAQVGECGISAKGDQVASDAGMTAFVERIFLSVKKAAPAGSPAITPAPKPTPAPAPEVIQEKKKPAEAKPEVAAPVETRKETIALNVQFDTGKAVVKPVYFREIEKVAEFLKKHPDTEVTIAGHTDNVGKEAANVKLSQARADAIAKLLVEKSGIESSRVKAVGYGPKKPIASNKTADGRQKNRRVEANIEAVVTK